MKLQISALTSTKGELARGSYAAWGIILFAVKYNLDRILSLYFRDQPWYFTDYFVQADNLAVLQLSEADRTFYLVILFQSLPFIWFGTVLTVKRLRHAGIPGELVLFFFIPFVNLVLFIVVAALPEKVDDSVPRKGFIERLIPTSEKGSALLAVGVTTLASVLLTVFFVNFLGEYGWSLFVGIPFFLGFGSTLLFGYRRALRFDQAFGVTMASLFFFGGLLFILAVEGLICIGMAFPIGVAIAMIGMLIGLAINRSRAHISLQSFILPLLTVPLLGVAERNLRQSPPLITVSTSIVVDAPREAVWRELVSFGHIQEPDEWIFKTGIAYPLNAEIDGTGVGAVRKCNFTTGSFVEPITVWDEPSLLAFSVLDQPTPMVEWSMYENLNIAHLDGYFKSVRGEFRLIEQPGEKTLLVGTTWYHHSIWPTAYWSLWSDAILHRIHNRVLQHIKRNAEGLDR